MLNEMKNLIEVFAAGVSDRSTLDELHAMIGDRKTWPNAHALLQRIRQKTLAAEKRGDGLADCQYLFEEVCAKTLYNLSGEDAPFDADSPYWIIPNALSLARRMNIHESEITRIVAGQPIVGADVSTKLLGQTPTRCSARLHLALCVRDQTGMPGFLIPLLITGVILVPLGVLLWSVSANAVRSQLCTTENLAN